MSVVAWDGAVIAADRQGTNAFMRSTISKIMRLESGYVLAWTGTQEHGLILAKWYKDGADKSKWPKFQETEDWVRLIVATTTGIGFYEKRPELQKVCDPFMAWGSGRDFAMGAMAMGASASEAVEAANKFSVDCGFGVECFVLANGCKSLIER